MKIINKKAQAKISVGIVARAFSFSTSTIVMQGNILIAINSIF